MAKTASRSLPIVISGTGPAALLFAHSLLRAVPTQPFRLYERDGSMQQRAQEYRFKITGRGTQACRDILRPEHLALLRATCADNLVGFQAIDPATGKPAPNQQWGNGNRSGRSVEDQPLTADRNVLRQALFRGLEQYTTFSKEVVGYDYVAPSALKQDGGGEKAACRSPSVTVRFADGSTEQAALLVVADGAWSRVRAQLQPHVRLLDTETRMVFGKTPLTPDFFAAADSTSAEDPHMKTLLKCFSKVDDAAPTDSPRFFMYEPMLFNSRAVAAKADPELAACIPDDYVYWALALRSDRSELQGLDWRSMTSASAADFAVSLAKDWHTSVRALVTQADRAQTMPLRSAVVPLPLQNWRRPGTDVAFPGSPMVTLIGDAAHAMPPTGGLGATTALTDAAVLGEAIAAHGVTSHALETYEAEMREYATNAIEVSMHGGKHIINMRGLEELKPI